MIKEVEIGWRKGQEEGTILVEVVYSRRRTMGLDIGAMGQVKARVPLRTPDGQVMNFIKDHQEWIVKKWFLIRERKKKRENRPEPDYVTHPELEKAYREQAKKRLEERAAFFAEQMGVTYNRIAVRAAKTRWGSCSAQGNLNFHWKLVLMPPDVLDYVVVHELAHRKEMNHSPRFWAEVEKVLPDYRQRRAWLKERGADV